MDVLDPVGLERVHVAGQFAAVAPRAQRGHERLEHQGGLARAGDTGDGGEPASGDADVELPDGVQRGALQADRAVYEDVRLRGALADDDLLAAVEERAEPGGGVGDDLLDAPLGDDGAAVAARAGADLEDLLGLAQQLHVVVDDEHGVTVSEQVADQLDEPLDVRGVHADAGLVEHVEHAGGAVADGAGELGALALPCREGGAGPVQGEIAEAEVDETLRHLQELVHEPARHRMHLGR